MSGQRERVRETVSGAELGQHKASIARVYDYFLGGKSNYVVDREAAEAVIGLWPAVEVAARENRAYTHRAVNCLAREGIRQFIDVGVGMPMAPNLHAVAQDVTPDATVVYADNDPIALVYAEDLRASTPEGTVQVVEGDATRPEDLLEAVAATGCVDFARPVALTLHALLHFIPDDQDPYGLVGRLLEPLAPGSYLSLSHASGDFDPATWAAVTNTYAQYGIRSQVRTRAEVLRFFTGLDLVDPGLVVAHRWRPPPGRARLVTDQMVAVYAGAARKP
ncbi:SAM-dependent methyltransferase [Streptomyces sp. NPDC056672]|uniref:SAM-dependent methyltransferase n=1 Tax=Streptomyces sp. NPDC056672 TaxID=3345906 RepID=UPI0036C717C4